MYTFIFYLVDDNDNIIYTTSSFSDIANLFGDTNISNCINEVELAMYLLNHYFHHTINGIKYYFAQQNISNVSMTFTMTYKKL